LIGVSEANRVADQLRAAILSGELADGSRLPSLSELAAAHGVSLDVARQAVAALRAERLAETRHGAGTFVRRFALITRSSPGRVSRQRWGTGEAIQDHDTGPRLRTVGVAVNEVPAPEFAAAALGVQPGEPVMARSRRFLVEHRPVQLSTSYLPVDVVRGTAAAYTDTGPGGMYARLAELGHAPVRFTERVSARAPYPDERTALEMAGTGGLVFEIVRFAYTESGRCIEVNRMILDATAYELSYEFGAE
jgi:GntR family transcriptional regulator